VNVEVRAPRAADAAELVDLINRDAVELGGEPEENEESIQLWLTAPDLNVETDARVVPDDGRLRGYADVTVHAPPKAWADLRVPPSEHDDEVRLALIDWAEERAAERVGGQPGALLRFFADGADAAIKRLLEERGYELIRHSYRMRIEFEQEIPEPEWPAGLVARPGRAEDAEAVYEVHQESFEDSWEHTRMPWDEWTHWLTPEGYDPSMWVVVDDGDEMAAVSMNRERDAEPGVGWVSVLGVRRPWRRRGVGRALLLASFHEFRRRGFHAAALGVDASSLTGANRLYERAGMSVVRRYDIYDGAL
jgi:mycothiol synthase